MLSLPYLWTLEFELSLPLLSSMWSHCYGLQPLPRELYCRSFRKWPRLVSINSCLSYFSSFFMSSRLAKRGAYVDSQELVPVIYCLSSYIVLCTLRVVVIFYAPFGCTVLSVRYKFWWQQKWYVYVTTVFAVWQHEARTPTIVAILFFSLRFIIFPNIQFKSILRRIIFQGVCSSK